MTRKLFLVGLLLSVLPAVAQVSEVVRGGRCNNDGSTTFSDYESFHTTETRTLPRSSFHQLNVHGAHNGGVTIQGWQGTDVELTICRFVGAENVADATRRLNSINVRSTGGEISADMPNDDNMTVHLYVKVPANISVMTDAHNGPISLRDVQGTINATTINGPISIKRCSGNITAEAQNGPIDVTGASGKVNVRAQNGPVDVSLNNAWWQGEGLIASTQNGPMTLNVPQDYQSGVEVVSDGHSPFSCRACSDTQRTWADDGSKRVHLGSPNAPAVVRLRTINGPVTVQNGDRSIERSRF